MVHAAAAATLRRELGVPAHCKSALVDVADRIALARAGDVNSITIGSNSSIGDNVVIHVSSDQQPTGASPAVVGNNVVVGMYSCGVHVHAHACTSCELVSMIDDQ